MIGIETTTKEIRKDYEQAVAEKQETFEHKGLRFVTNYAKYLLEHLENEGVPKNKKLLFEKET